MKDAFISHRTNVRTKITYGYQADFTVDGRGIYWSASVKGPTGETMVAGEIEMEGSEPFDARAVVGNEVNLRIDDLDE